jgi:DNA-directed RNA polymerase subunit M/transcription elongation factor TFIIS
MMQTFKQPEETRANIVAKFQLEFGFDEKQSANLEKSVYNYTIKEATTRLVVKKWDNPYFVLIYTNKLRSVFENMTEENIDKIKRGEFNPCKVAFMTHQELNYEKWKLLLEEKAKTDKNKYETQVQSATDTFTCRKCKKNRCTYYQLQTRSSDEAITTFVTCLECDNRWKC